MSDAKATTKNNQNNPLSKPPLAINLANKASELEDDLEALKLKQANKDARPKTNASASPSPDTRSKSPDRPVYKPPAADTTPKKDGLKPAKTRTMPAKSIAALSGGFLNNYDPYDDIQAGKSEEEVTMKLKSENLKLRKELKAISDELTVLVDKKRLEKTEEVVHPPHARDYIAGTATSEKGLQSELGTAQKQLTRLKKQTDQMGNKYEAHGKYEKIQARQAHLYELENKISEIVTQTKQTDKSVREKERALDTLLNQNQSGHNVQITAMDEDARLYREKVREGDRKRDHLEKQAQKRKEYTQNLITELETLKQNFKRIQEKTGYEAKEKPKPKPDTSFNSAKAADTGIKSKKTPMFKQTEEELACNEENFEKLKKEINILQQAEEKKGKRNKKEIETYQNQINTYEKNIDDTSTRINERKKEIELLNTKLKDLSRIVRHHAVAPLQEELVARELPDSVMKRNPSPSRSSPGRNSRSSSKSRKDLNVKRPQPMNMLAEYAKHNFQSKGYRKDEKGKPVREEEGVNFNDRDIIGKQKVKIIAIDIWYDDHGITGIQSIYENDKKTVIEGRKHVTNEEKSKKATFETLEEDYLKEISGFMNRAETALECLILRTFRGETMRVGAPGRDSKLFKFDINEMEYPSIIFGSLKDEKNNSSRLARLGVLISTQSVEEKIESKENKDEKGNSPTAEEKQHDKSEEHKEGVIEEVEDNIQEDRSEQRNSHRSDGKKSAKGDDGQEDRPIEEAIDGDGTRRSKHVEKGDPSPRKE